MYIYITFHMIILSTVPFETPELCFVGPRYLNDVGTGGHTLFPTLGIKVKPSKGSASLGLVEKKPVIPKLYHLESRWRNSYVLVYHGPLLIHLFGVAPSTFTMVYHEKLGMFVCVFLREN